MRLVLVSALLWLAAGGPDAVPSAAAATTILESSLLRLEVTTEPYSYAVIEKSTGQVLLRQAETTFTAGTARAARTAAIGRKGANGLEAVRSLSADRRRARGARGAGGKRRLRLPQQNLPRALFDDGVRVRRRRDLQPQK